MENLFNVNQVAFILKVHPLTIRRYIRQGKLKAVKVGGSIRIREKDLNDFNQEITLENPSIRSPFKKNINVAKVFTTADPFLRMRGRAASIELD